MRTNYQPEHLRFVDDLIPNESLRAPVRDLVQQGYGVCGVTARSAQLVREGFFGERTITVRLLEGDQIELRRR